MSPRPTASGIITSQFTSGTCLISSRGTAHKVAPDRIVPTEELRDLSRLAVGTQVRFYTDEG